MKKTGMYSWFGHMAPMEDRLRMIKEAGFDSTMLWWGDAAAFFEYDKENLIKKVIRTGLEVENIHVPYQKINYLWEQSLNSEDLISKIKEWVKDCSSFGIEGMVLHVENDNMVIKDYKYGTDNINRILEVAERLNILIALENTKQYKPLEYIFNNVHSKHLRFCYDSSHDWLSTGSRGSILEKYGYKLTYLHLSDNDLDHDRHWIPERGNINWDKIAELLTKINFKGNISFEVCPWEMKMDGKDILKEVYAFSEKFIKKL
jgi:sugar phosphate isomerase/epimerase